MIEPTHIVAYGRVATEALAATVADAQRTDPLAPVTVVVGSNFVGLSVRRLLGTDVVGSRAAGRGAGRVAGLANVSFVTPFRFAEQLAADLLLDTRPLTGPVLGAAVRAVLAAEPREFAPVARHEATEAALAALFTELSAVDPAGLEAMADEGSTAADLAVGLHRAIGERLAGFHTEREVALAAAERSDLGARLVPFGHVVWYLPTPLSPALGQFVGRALRAASAASVIVGVTSATAADEPVWRSCDAAGVARPIVASPSTVDGPGASSPPTADRIVSVTDAAEEVREACRGVLDVLQAGTPPHRIGIFYPMADPYAGMIEHQFDAAGIVVNGPDRRRLADSAAGRTLVGALELPDVRWRRDRVIALVSAGPLRSGDGRVRATAWDDISREAGVIADVGDWRAKLERQLTAWQQRIEHLPTSSGDAADIARRRRRIGERLDDTRGLLGFVQRLAADVAAVEQAPTWADKARAATELLHALLGPEHQHASWPESEQDAFGRVEAALVRLGGLDEVEPSPTHAVFARALRAELDVSRGRRGRFGDGVMFGPLASAVGHDLDAVFVLGAAEGVLPVPRRDDAILPERVRAHSLDQLESKTVRLHHQHRAFLAALAAAPEGRRTITFPRGDLRSSRRGLPSRWLLDTATARAGRIVHATDFDELDSGVVDVVGSFASGIRRPGPATSLAERDLIALGQAVSAGADAVGHPLAALVGDGLAVQRARSGPRFTEFDGNLAAIADDPVDGPAGPHARPMSPSQLETWAACGLRYFLRYVLDVADRDDPERTDDISAADRGSLIHVILERFVGEAIASGPPAPDEAWSPDARRRLHEIADDACRDFEDGGRTGRAANWRVRRDDVHDVLDTFLVVDDEFRRSRRATPRAVELDFGVRSGEAVEIALPTSTTVTLRGIADRVDVTADGRAIVSDYKSGRGKRFDHLDDDPFNGGTTLQLGMYAEGALRATGASSAEAAYWMVEGGRDVRRGYRWTPELRSRFDDVLVTIAAGIERGVFAATPGDWDVWRQTNENCTFCDFDSVCVRNRGEQAEAKLAAPEGTAIRHRLVPEAAAGPDDAGSVA